MGKHRKTTGTEEHVETKETTRNYGNERLGKYFSVPICLGNPLKVHWQSRRSHVQVLSTANCYAFSLMPFND